MVFSIISSVFVQYPNIRAETVTTPNVVDNNITGSLSSFSSRLPAQTHTFYASGRHWVFYWAYDDDIVYTSSIDGITWENRAIVTTAIAAAYFDTFYDGTYIYYVVRNIILDLYFRRGTLNSNGTITWDSADQKVSTSSFADPTITVDNAGYAYISGKRTSNHTCAVFKNAWNNGSWSTDWTYWVNSSAIRYHSKLLHLSTSNDIYVYYFLSVNDNRTAKPILGKLWNGTAWSAEENVTNSSYNVDTSYYGRTSATAIGDTIHLVYLENASKNITYTNRTNGNWGNVTNLYSNAPNSSPVISYDVDSEDLFVFWQGTPSPNGTYYLKYNGTWETTPNLISNETINGLSRTDTMGSSHKSASSMIDCIYMVNTTSTKTLKHFYLYTGTSLDVSTNTTTGVGEQNATLHGYLNSDGGETCRVGFQWGETTSYGHTDFDLPFTSGWNPSGSSETELFQFPKDIWLYNTSIESNNTCENFCQQGGIYDKISWIFRYNSTADSLTSWLKDREINWLTHIDNSTDHPEFYYTFYVSSADTLEFTYDNLIATTGEEFGHQIGIIGGLHVYGLTPETTYHYRTFATNSTTTVYGSDMSFTTTSNWTATLNCFNASDGSPITDWDVFITNQNGSHVYTSLNNDNSHYVNLSNGTCPTGTNIAFMFSKENYTNITYYLDISLTGNYTLNAYLSSINLIHLYTLIVTDEYNTPLEDVKVSIKQYINETLGYKNITIVNTDAVGSVQVSLISNILYKILLKKEGYVNGEEDYKPDPDYYGIYYPKYFQIISEEEEIEIKTFDDICEFTGEWVIANSTLKIYFYDSYTETTDVTFNVYESYNNTLTWKEKHTYTSDSDITFYNTSALNTSRMHKIILEMNHTTLGHITNQTIFVNPMHTPEHEEEWVEEKFVAVGGTFDLGYVKFFILFLPSAILIIGAAAIHQPGAGILGAGLYLTFVSWQLKVDIPTAITIIVGLFILLGVITIIGTKGKSLIKRSG